jgi:hypothetical protein
VIKGVDWYAQLKPTASTDIPVYSTAIIAPIGAKDFIGAQVAYRYVSATGSNVYQSSYRIRDISVIKAGTEFANWLALRPSDLLALPNISDYPPYSPDMGLPLGDAALLGLSRVNSIPYNGDLQLRWCYGYNNLSFRYVAVGTFWYDVVDDIDAVLLL